MDIGIDALPLMGQGGVSRYLRELFPALLAADPTHRYHLFARVFRPDRARRYREARQAFDGPSVRWHRLPLPDRLLELAWTRHDVTLPGTRHYLRRLHVFLATAGLAPTGTPCPVVGVVHDLVPLRFPQWYAADLPRVRRRLERLVARSRLVIAVSESTGRDLRQLLGVPEERIRVVHHGIHPRFAPPDRARVQATLAARGIAEPFFLYVGGFGAVKNVRALLEAFREFRGRQRPSHQLILAGDPRWAGTLPSDVDSLELAGSVRFLGFVDDGALPGLYAAAAAAVLPSWHESFGFPALEAMACGAPVIASRVGALPELLGDAALFFSPETPGELVAAMTRVATDPDLRRELGRRGRARAARYTWERAATETLEVLRDAAAAVPLQPASRR